VSGKKMTREILEAMSSCSGRGCGECCAEGYCKPSISTAMELLASALLAEMDKPKVWDGAPENAVIAQVHFYKAAKTYATPSAIPMVYTRERPKSRAREIAEEAWSSFRDRKVGNGDDYINSLEAAILKREAELRGES
jgi:hypothetical protein